MFRKIILFINTIRYLKFIQIYYQIWYRFKKVFNLGCSIKTKLELSSDLIWQDYVYNEKTYFNNYSFRFINLNHNFKLNIDWNFSEHKKLWTYNLNYFDYLNQENISKNQGLELMRSFVFNYHKLNCGKEPYPSSLRIINWVKFISKHKIKESNILKTIFSDASRLCNQIEYHLLGNHLLENGFALWFAAHLFENKKFFNLSTRILKSQLEEQILIDGAHFELSPMYHQLMLFRVLDCILLAEKNNSFHSDMISILREQASKMSSWLKQITFKNGDIPLFNDAAKKINPCSNLILKYAKDLGINEKIIPLKDSGYRRFNISNYELICDVGQLGATYQPGHAHADTFNFELYVNQQAIIVDTGTSTYNMTEDRAKERSTKAHNTVTINNENSSQVWGGFRVAKRAKITKLVEDSRSVSAAHNGYSSKKIIHHRSWTCSSDLISIKDWFNQKDVKAKAYLHFHPKVSIQITNNKIILNKHIKVSLENSIKINVNKFLYRPEFNLGIPSRCIEVEFIDHLVTNISNL